MTLFQTKKCHFPHPSSVLASKVHHSFQTLEEVTKRNIHAYKDRDCIIRTPTKEFLKIIISNSHITGLFLNWNQLRNMFIHHRRSLENYTWFQTIMGKVYNRFQTKTAQDPYPLGRPIPIWTRDRRIASPTRRPLGHAASLNGLDGVISYRRELTCF